MEIPIDADPTFNGRDSGPNFAALNEPSLADRVNLPRYQVRAKSPSQFLCLGSRGTAPVCAPKNILLDSLGE